MSDYLKHLAARSLNRTLSIQPRLASRFEPPSRAAASPPASEPALDRDQLDMEDDTRRLSPPDAAAPPRAGSQQRMADVPPRSLDAVPRSLDSSQRAFDASPRSDARAGIRPRVDTEQTRAASSMMPPHQPQPSSVFAPPPGQQPSAHTSSGETSETRRDAPAQSAQDARAALQPEDDTPTPRRPPATNESALERNIRRIVAGEFEARDAEAEVDRAPRPPVRDGDRKRQVVEPISIVAARADAGREQAARDQADASAQTSPPIIRVTIGRIEVRAVNTPAPPGARGEARPAAEARPDPARSLREYLKQRSGGRP
jgi:hypothetical protein